MLRLRGGSGEPATFHDQQRCRERDRHQGATLTFKMSSYLGTSCLTELSSVQLGVGSPLSLYPLGKYFN